MEIIPKKAHFIELYNKEADAIFRFCLMRTSHRDVARDLTQEAFTKLWESMALGTPIQNHRAFVFTIARNLIISWYRKKKAVSLDDIVDESAHGDIPLIDDEALRDIEMHGEARFLIEKIKELEPMYQQVVYLRFVEDLKPKEIAQIVGESENVVSVRINRGIEKLREITGYTRHENI